MNTNFDKLYDKIISENKQYKRQVIKEEPEFRDNSNEFIHFDAFFEAVQKNTNIMNLINSGLQSHGDTDELHNLVTQVWLNYGTQFEDQLYEKYGHEAVDTADDEQLVEWFLEVLNLPGTFEAFKNILENFNYNQAEDQFPNPNPEDNVQEIPEDFREEPV